MDREVSTSLAFLHHKVSTIFPTLKGRETILSWEDREGDEVSIGTDEELVTALTEMEAPVYKLKVRVGSGRKEIHPGVVCDGCNGCVLGLRYKCLHCTDYDLCSRCQDKGLHSHHTKVRIPAPTGGRIQGPGHHLSRMCSQPLVSHCYFKPLTVRSSGDTKKEAGKDHQGREKGQGSCKENLVSQSSSLESPSMKHLYQVLMPIVGPALASVVFPVLETIVNIEEKNNNQNKEEEKAKTGNDMLEKKEVKTCTEDLAKEEVKSGLMESDKSVNIPEKVNSEREKINTDRPDQKKENPVQDDDTKEDSEFEVVTEQETEEPKVALALAAMKEMGFTDEEGWLSTLLRSKIGGLGLKVQE